MEEEDPLLIFHQSLQSLIMHCASNIDEADLEVAMEITSRLTSSVRTLDYLFNDCNELQMHVDFPAEYSTLQELLNACQELQIIWSRKLVTLRTSNRCISEPGQISSVKLFERSLNPGKPRLVLDIESILFLFDYGFRVNVIAKMHLVHRVTIWRRLQEHGIQIDRFSSISDEELNEIVREIYADHPHCGVSMMLGHLRSRNIFIQRYRVRLALKQIDPANSALRWGMAIRRRTYVVPGPNSLWHVDGHHALIRWRLVTHGGIDGYSRMVVYLKCSANNRSETVFNAFLEAVALFGMPSRVRGDRGTENTDVCAYMEEMRGGQRGSFIAGPSVHNTRIERLWKDVFYSVINTYYSLFYYLENANLLDITDDLDLFCLHFVYIPRINKALTEFSEAYNSHPLRTEKHWSPNQIWINGMLDANNRQQTAVRDIWDSTRDNSYMLGIDANEQNISEFDYLTTDTQVVVPETINPLSEEQYMALISLFSPLDPSDQYGIEIYVNSRSYLRRYLE